MTREVVIILSDNVIEVRRLRNTVTGALQSSATVEATIKDSNGDNLTGITQPITLSAVSGTDGLYRGSFPAQDISGPTAVVVGTLLTVIITANAGAGLYRTKTFVAEVKG